MEKRIAVLIGLVFLVLLSLASNSVAQAAPAQISVSPANIEVSHGETFTIEIMLDPKDNEVYGAQYALYFNNNLLAAHTQTLGTFLSQDGAKTNVFANETNNTMGRIVYGVTRTETLSGVSNPGTLASVTFKVIGTSGTSYQKLSNVKLTNPNVELIEIETNDGTCSIGEVTGESAVVDITVEEAHRMLEEEPEGIILLDVRTEDEYNIGHIDMSNVELKNIPKDELENRLDELDGTKKIIVYCKDGVDSRTANEILVRYGSFGLVYNMVGGIKAWRLHRDFPVSSAPSTLPSSTPTAATPMVSPTSTPMVSPTSPAAATPMVSPTSPAAATPATSGFEAVLTMAMLAISYLLLSKGRRRNDKQ